MAMGEHHRGIGQFVAVGLLVAALVITRLLGVRVEQWPPAAQLASIALIAVASLIVTLRISKRRGL